MLSVTTRPIMLSVIMPSVVMLGKLNVVMLSFMALQLQLALEPTN